MAEDKIYDCIVLGAGPAGMAASIYLSRYKVEHLIFGEVPGGQVVDAPVVENYPGFTSISGADLAQAFRGQAESYGVKIREEMIGEIHKKDGHFEVKSKKGDLYKAETVILALGARHRLLNVPGEDEFLGKGVSYCAICDAPFFKGKDVAVVGGGNSAVATAIHLASHASKVYIVHRREEYRAQPYEVEKLRSLQNVEEILGNTVKKIQGKNVVERILLAQPYRDKTELSVQGVFVEVGLIPASSIAKALRVKMDEQGYIKINSAMGTSVSGVFAAGDLALIPGAIPLRQVITSAADGARAASAVYQYLHQQHPTPDWG